MNRLFGNYILKDGKVVSATTTEWVEWFQTGDRVVAHSKFDDADVSTVFLGQDISFGKGQPLLFETMIFDGKHDGRQFRCSTWGEAELMHAKAVALVTDQGPETDDD